MRGRGPLVTCALAVTLLVAGALVPPPAAADVGDVHLSVSTDRADYRAGEPVNITVTFSNAGTTPVTLHFPSSCIASFNVTEDGGRLQYRHRLHMECLAVLTEFTLGPAASMTERFTWDLKGDDGRMMGTDGTLSYTVTGLSESYEPIPPATASFTITGTLIRAPGPIIPLGALAAVALIGVAVLAGALLYRRRRLRRLSGPPST